MSYTGHCACGAVTVALAGEPFGVGQCWCRQCQRIAAGSASNNAIFRADQVTTTGDLTVHTYPAESGNMSIQSFCAACGTPVFGGSSALAAVVAVKLGILEQPHDLRPGMVMWTSEAPAWAVIDPALPQFPKSPPMPAPAEAS
ncbi:GFA family protein [Novosphingobium sp. JCM 18896]|uniref:GFA family protein n=1 Tax=Novosphingobium sp. JCM 18896 TaxID=2989731 RepID=UPI002223CBB0|nr:GFA family protein [Novosphingobium sp. JCM 18896]MCW1428419.1 GFA family protein [Novosphingobium sp. JCM 18896]